MAAWYNDIEPFACDVIRANIERGRLPAGIVDDLSITDIRTADLRGHAQCHFFAGIGGMAYGLRLAGWPDDLSVWTGGFPCQDVSVAGRGAGLAGARSGLWFEWLRLIDECRPDRLLIENVPALRTRGADDVLAALERIGYACLPLVVGAWAVGAPHRRNRVWIVADRTRGGLRTDGRSPRDAGHTDECGADVSDAERAGRRTRRGEPGDETGARERRRESARSGELEHATQPGLERRWEGLSGQAGDGLADAGGECDGGGAALARRGQIGRIAARWPSRPGEQQREWERPRLVEFRVGCRLDGLPGGLVRYVVEITGWSEASALAWIDRNKFKIAAAQNKAGLKGFGNAVVPQCVAAVARAWLEAIVAENIADKR